jgi:cyanate lyase
MTRDEVTAQIVAARLAKGLTWQALADAVNRPLVWTTAALLGQHPFTREDASTLIDLLGLPIEALDALTAVPYRAAVSSMPPTDPTIYRFYEALGVYGPALKELIHEQFGDGIMSAINFKLDIGKTQHDGVDHVVVTFDGKFLPYAWPTD